MDTTEIEYKIIGTILTSGEVSEKMFSLLTPDHFTNQSLVEVFKSFQLLKESNQDINVLTLVQDLKKRKRLDYVGGIVEVSKLSNSFVGYDLFCDFVLLLSEHLYRRKLIIVASRIQMMATDESHDVFEAISVATKLIDEVNEVTDNSKEPDKKELITELLNDIPKRKERGFQGAPCYIRTVDNTLGGFDLVGTTVIAGRPGQGKTSVALSMATQMVKNGMKGAFFTLEMSASSIYSKLLAIDGSIRTYAINRGTLTPNEWNQIDASAERIISYPIQVFDKYFKVSEIVSKCRQMKNKGELDFVFIDYLQLMELGNGNKGNREQEVSAISRALKKMAMQLEIPVFELSQLSRKVEERADKKPMLSDLRESGSIEQDASTVLFCYRPSYYGITGESGESLENEAYLICGKHRNGGLTDIKLHYKHDHNQEWCDEGSINDFPSTITGSALSQNLNF